MSETNSANILLVKDNTVLVPDSAHALPGVMQASVCKVLAGWGFTIQNQKILPETLFEADLVLLTNALMGAAPVVDLDGMALRLNTDLGYRINARVL